MTPTKPLYCEASSLVIDPRHRIDFCVCSLTENIVDFVSMLVKSIFLLNGTEVATIHYEKRLLGKRSLSSHNHAINTILIVSKV